MPRKPPRDEARLAAQRQLGLRVKEAREAVGWSQREAAEIFGFRSNSAVSNLENGRNGVDAIELSYFARQSGYPLEYFVNPNFESRSAAWPKTLIEWKNFAGGDKRRAEAHYSLDRAIVGLTPTAERIEVPPTQIF